MKDTMFLKYTKLQGLDNVPVIKIKFKQFKKQRTWNKAYTYSEDWCVMLSASSLSEDRKEFLMLPKLERLAYGFQLHEGAKAKNSKSSFCLCILILSWIRSRSDRQGWAAASCSSQPETDPPIPRESAAPKQWPQPFFGPSVPSTVHMSRENSIN